MDENPTTEERAAVRKAMPETVKEPGLPEKVSQLLNRHLKGWANYFSFAYATGVHRELDWFVRGRLIRHLQRRSQRPFQPPEGVPWYRFFQKLGLVSLAPAGSGPAQA